jgi:dTDP-4-amino-4,6-dideoxygalactose transaminase
MRQLEAKGIGCGVHYLCHFISSEAYASLGHERRFPVSEQIADECLSLPMFPSLPKHRSILLSKPLQKPLARG